jgi:O-acetyl-ADP-ribose deacetylase (regulator of RNase III)
MRARIGKGTVVVLQGNIAGQDTTAIVNAANNSLWMGSGVAGAIKRTGGGVIEQEAMALGPIGVGEAVLTSAGTLKARHVIHAVVMGQDLHTDAGLIARATRSSLELAERQALSSIAFPALGTGVGGFPIAECARIMIEETASFLQHAAHVVEVRFVLFDETACRAFEQALGRHA